VQPVPTLMSIVDRVCREVERNALRVRNGIRLAAGIMPAGVGQTPKEIVVAHWEQ
jgi:polyhydroxyalkanoate synthase